MIEINCTTIAGMRKADSGRPLYLVTADGEIMLQGVLSDGGIFPEGLKKIEITRSQYSNAANLKNWVIKVASLSLKMLFVKRSRKNPLIQKKETAGFTNGTWRICREKWALSLSVKSCK